ncbi:MAG: hypothetical protein HY650_03330 [Acidobacteria bacterium]|nr:hypothetical protein [Acidobacteriota bacterium]
MMPNAQPSPEVLVEQVLEALARNDGGSLKNLALTKEEFCDILWPELPSSETPNLTCDWVWNTFGPSSLNKLSQTLGAHAGRKYQLVRLRCVRGTTAYKSLKVHEDCRVVVGDDEGRERELKLFGSILEMDGQFKLCNFIVD